MDIMPDPGPDLDETEERRRACRAYCGPAHELEAVRAELRVVNIKMDEMLEDLEDLKKATGPMLSVYRDGVGASRVIKWVAGTTILLGAVYALFKGVR